MSIIFYTKFPELERAGFDTKKYFSAYMTSNIIVCASSKNVSYKPHPGGPLSVKYVFKGEEYYTSNTYKYRVKSDSFMVFNEQQEYGSYINSEEVTDSFSVFFKPDYVREVLSSLITSEDTILKNPFYPNKSRQPVNFVERLYPKDNYIVPILANLCSAIKNKNYPEAFFNEQLYFLLEGLIFTNRRLYKEIEKVSAVKKSTRLEIYRRLNIAKDYIESCYNEKITLSSLAKASNMCEHHLLRMFKKYYKLTPYQYLLETRLRIAKRLLSDSSKSISEISHLAGFEYLSSFSEAFNKRFRQSPTAFRNTQKVNF
jgi:AraC family transcriptional regulator